MKTFKQFLIEAQSKDILFFSDLTKSDIGKSFKIFDSFEKKTLIKQDKYNRVYNIADVIKQHKHVDSTYASLETGSIIKIVDINEDPWNVKVLFAAEKVADNATNVHTYHHNGNDRININGNDLLFYVEVERKAKNWGSDPYLKSLDSKSGTSGSLIGLHFLGSFTGKGDNEQHFEFDESTENKTFYGNLNASRNNLTSLKGSPKEVVGFFYVYGNKLQDLVGAPTKIIKSFKSTLPGMQTSFGCSSNEQLTSLKGIPEYLEGGADFRGCTSLTSISGLGSHLKHCEELNFAGCPIKSGVLSLFKIKGLTKVTFVEPGDSTPLDEDLTKVEEIVNKHLASGDAMECQDELLDVGLSEYAKL